MRLPCSFSSSFFTPPTTSACAVESSSARSNEAQRGFSRQGTQLETGVSEKNNPAISSSFSERRPSEKSLGKRPATQSTAISLSLQKRRRVEERVISSGSEDEQQDSPRTRMALRRNNSQEQ